MTPTLINPPADIHEGTINHVIMIIQACSTGNAREAEYLATDLLDQLYSKALIVSKRDTTPGYALGYKAGCADTRQRLGGATK